jgi:hypothetical protein
MSNELAQLDNADKILSVLVDGDLAKLTPTERVNYYNAVCQSVGLNPLTKPFQFITLNGKLTMYALKGATDQLRAVNGVSIDPPKIERADGWITVTVTGTDRNGRRDSEIGVVSEKDMQGNYANSLMKAVTKAKRRLTLAMCGLGMLDETEVETIPNARVVDDRPTPSALPANASEGLVKQNANRIRKDDWKWEASKVRDMNKAISEAGDEPAEVINYAYEAGVKTPDQFWQVWNYFIEQCCSFRGAVDSLFGSYDPTEEAVEAEVMA